MRSNPSNPSGSSSSSSRTIAAVAAASSRKMRLKACARPSWAARSPLPGPHRRRRTAGRVRRRRSAAPSRLPGQSRYRPARRGRTASRAPRHTALRRGPPHGPACRRPSRAAAAAAGVDRGAVAVRNAEPGHAGTRPTAHPRLRAVGPQGGEAAPCPVDITHRRLLHNARSSPAVSLLSAARCFGSRRSRNRSGNTRIPAGRPGLVWLHRRRLRSDCLRSRHTRETVCRRPRPASPSSSRWS